MVGRARRRGRSLAAARSGRRRRAKRAALEYVEEVLTGQPGFYVL
jgi:hypothetical protein